MSSRHFIPGSASPQPTAAEVMTAPQSASRGVFVEGLAPDGQSWTHVATPIRIEGITLPRMRAAGCRGLEVMYVLV